MTICKFKTACVKLKAYSVGKVLNIYILEYASQRQTKYLAKVHYPPPPLFNSIGWFEHILLNLFSKGLGTSSQTYFAIFLLFGRLVM